MKSSTNQSLLALAFVALMSSCGRPYATFQKTTPEHFYTKAAAKPVAAPALAESVPAAQSAEPLLAETVIAPAGSVDAELKKVDALVSAKAGLSTSKKLTRSLARVKEMVAQTRATVAAPASTVGNTASSSVAPQKMNLMQRMVAKSIDKKIQHKLAPQKTMARGLLSIGLIVALIGLLLVLVGTGTVYSLGYVGLIVGIILIIASLI